MAELPPINVPVAPQSRRAIGAEVAALPGTANLGWMRVSSKPLKQALATWASKWVYLFTKYLQDKVRPAKRGVTATWGFCSVHPCMHALVRACAVPHVF